MNTVMEEILQEIKNKCDVDTYAHLNSFITVRFRGYKIIKEETGIVRYKESENEKLYKMFFISKKLQGLSDRSLKVYKSEIDKLMKNINKPFKEITSDDIKYYLACYKLKGTANNTTIDNSRRFLNTFFQFLEDEDWINKNPVKKIKKVKQIKAIKKAFSYEEIEKLKINCETDREFALITLLLSTGARATEVSNMKKSDVDFETGAIKVLGKGNKERIVYANAESLIRLEKYLKTRKGDSEYLFCSKIKPYSKLEISQIEVITRELGKRAEVEKVHPHRFRRTCATVAKRRGMPIEEIQMLLGHEDLGTTQIYVQVDTEDIKKSHEKYMN